MPAPRKQYVLAVCINGQNRRGLPVSAAPSAKGALPSRVGPPSCFTSAKASHALLFASSLDLFPPCSPQGTNGHLRPSLFSGPHFCLWGRGTPGHPWFPLVRTRGVAIVREALWCLGSKPCSCLVSMPAPTPVTLLAIVPRIPEEPQGRLFE